MASKKLTIHIEKINGYDILGFDLKEVTKDEAIVILNRCLHHILQEYDYNVKVEN